MKWRPEIPPRDFFEFSPFNSAIPEVRVNVNVLRWLMNKYPRAVLVTEHPLDGAIDLEANTLRWKETGAIRQLDSTRLAGADISIPLIGGLVPAVATSPSKIEWGTDVVDGFHRIATALRTHRRKISVHTLTFPLALLATETSLPIREYKMTNAAPEGARRAFSALAQNEFGALCARAPRDTGDDFANYSALEKYMGDFWRRYPDLLIAISRA